MAGGVSGGVSDPRPLIVHLSCDFPDAVQPRKTRAIAELVEGTADRIDHRVYSLNRVSPGLRWPGKVERVADDGRVASWTYAAPSRGLFLATAMARVAEAVLDDIARRGLRPALVQGHKLSVEGLAARAVAQVLGVPYALSLQGNTDRKILSVRRDLRGRYAQVFHGAARVFPFAPWIWDWCVAQMGAPAALPVVLPCVPVRDDVMAPGSAPARVISAFHLDHHRLKNAGALIAATARAAGQVPGLTLEIAGDGAVGARAAIDAAIAREQAPARRIGHVAATEIQAWMNGAAAFVMPSRRETFGMVFVEALLAGCPIVYPADRAIAGYFPADCSFAIPVDPDDTDAIGAAIATLVREQEPRKAALRRWQAEGGPDQFRRATILNRYEREIVNAA